MADETQGQQPTTPTTSADASNAAAIADVRAAARAAIMADDSIVVESPASEPAPTDDAPEAEAAPETPAEPEDKPPAPERKTIAELAALAEEKRRERLQREAQAKREHDARTFEEERRAYEARVRQLEARERELLEDPIEYAERYKGWDRSTAVERAAAKQLRPKEAQLEELLQQQAQEIKALRERYETDTKTRVETEQQRAWEAHVRETYSKWDNLTGNAERFPTLASFDSEERRFYGDRTYNLLAAHLGREPTQEEVADQVEYDLAQRFRKSEPAGNASSGGESKTKDGSPRGGKQKSPSTLTNDLASESAGSSRNLLDPEVRRRNALLEAERHGLR